MSPNQLSHLYRTLAGPLERIVRADVRASDAVIEDACQYAWGRFVSQPGGVTPEATLSWLVTTALREAWRLGSSDRRELPLEEGVGPAVAGPHELVDARERLRSLAALPVRQQRMLWLRGLGLSYGEMAEHEGCSRRTVERQLLRAKDRLRRAA